MCQGRLSAAWLKSAPPRLLGIQDHFKVQMLQILPGHHQLCISADYTDCRVTRRTEGWVHSIIAVHGQARLVKTTINICLIYLLPKAMQ